MRPNRKHFAIAKATFRKWKFRTGDLVQVTAGRSASEPESAKPGFKGLSGVITKINKRHDKPSVQIDGVDVRSSEAPMLSSMQLALLAFQLACAS